MQLQLIRALHRALDGVVDVVDAELGVHRATTEVELLDE